MNEKSYRPNGTKRYSSPLYQVKLCFFFSKPKLRPEKKVRSLSGISPTLLSFEFCVLTAKKLVSRNFAQAVPELWERIFLPAKV